MKIYNESKSHIRFLWTSKFALSWIVAYFPLGDSETTRLWANYTLLWGSKVPSEETLKEWLSTMQDWLTLKKLGADDWPEVVPKKLGGLVTWLLNPRDSACQLKAIFIHRKQLEQNRKILIPKVNRNDLIKLSIRKNYFYTLKVDCKIIV